MIDCTYSTLHFAIFPSTIFITLSFKLMILASLKNLGAKTTSLFERKKKDVEQLAQEKAAEAQKIAEEQVKLASDSLTKAKTDAEKLASSTGKPSFPHQSIAILSTFS